MANIELRLLRALMSRFDELKAKLNDGEGGLWPFKNGLKVEEAENIAKLLGLKAENHPCYVCQKSFVITLEAYNDNVGWYTICIASGSKVPAKGGPDVYVCRDCLYGKDSLRERLVKELEPTLKRFDELKLS